jgi:putative addiction module component (TIGR02574 family)
LQQRSETTLTSSFGIGRLSVDERLQLVEETWDSIADEVEGSPLTDAQRQEVDRRWAAHLANPQAAVPWEQVEAEILNRLSR